MDKSPLDGQKAWIKCDMVTTVTLERLDRIKMKTKEGTKWGTKQLSEEVFQSVCKGVANYLGFNHNS